MARILVTSALPYINGIKHVGNLAGSMLPADVYVRAMRQMGHEVLFISATDEHGTPAELAAANAGQPVAEYCARMHRIQKRLGEAWGLSFDWFGRSSSAQNRALTQHFAKKLDEAGLIDAVESAQIYSPEDGRFLPDRYVVGTCPECGYEQARGDQCENCTKQLDPTDLLSPRSAISGATDLEVRRTRHLFLRQSRMRKRLSDWIDRQKDWPKLSRSIARKWLDDGEGLQDRGITRDLRWGVPVRRGDAPWPGMEGKVFYVWFDAPIEYIAATREWAEATDNDWQRWWRCDKGAQDVRYVQFMGKDNVPFHALSFPATLMGSGEPWKRVDCIKSFNWLNYEGGKFSTSQRRGIFMDEALELLPADTWRWWLSANAPETGDSDFTWESFQTAVNRDLADNLGNFVSRVTKFCATRFGREIPKGGVRGAREAQLAEDLARLLADLRAALEAIQIRRAASTLKALWSLGNEYLQDSAPWALMRAGSPQESREAARGQAAMCIRTCFNLICIYATVSAPFIPETGARILRALNPPQGTFSDWPHDAMAALHALPEGHAFTMPGNLFGKVPDDVRDAWKALFGGERQGEAPGTF